MDPSQKVHLFDPFQTQNIGRRTGKLISTRDGQMNSIENFLSDSEPDVTLNATAKSPADVETQKRNLSTSRSADTLKNISKCQNYVKNSDGTSLSNQTLEVFNPFPDSHLGRRTGKDILAGKKKLIESNGIGNFSDFFSDSDDSRTLNPTPHQSLSVNITGKGDQETVSQKRRVQRKLTPSHSDYDSKRSLDLNNENIQSSQRNEKGECLDGSQTSLKKRVKSFVFYGDDIELDASKHITQNFNRVRSATSQKGANDKKSKSGSFVSDEDYIEPSTSKVISLSSSKINSTLSQTGSNRIFSHVVDNADSETTSKFLDTEVSHLQAADGRALREDTERDFCSPTDDMNETYKDGNGKRNSSLRSCKTKSLQASPQKDINANKSLSKTNSSIETSKFRVPPQKKGDKKAKNIEDLRDSNNIEQFDNEDSFTASQHKEPSISRSGSRVMTPSNKSKATSNLDFRGDITGSVTQTDKTVKEQFFGIRKRLTFSRAFIEANAQDLKIISAGQGNNSQEKTDLDEEKNDDFVIIESSEIVTSICPEDKIKGGQRSKSNTITRKSATAHSQRKSAIPLKKKNQNEAPQNLSLNVSPVKREDGITVHKGNEKTDSNENSSILPHGNQNEKDYIIRGNISPKSHSQRDESCDMEAPENSNRLSPKLKKSDNKSIEQNPDKDHLISYENQTSTKSEVNLSRHLSQSECKTQTTTEKDDALSPQARRVIDKSVRENHSKKNTKLASLKKKSKIPSRKNARKELICEIPDIPNVSPKKVKNTSSTNVRNKRKEYKGDINSPLREEKKEDLAQEEKNSSQENIGKNQMPSQGKKKVQPEIKTSATSILEAENVLFEDQSMNKRSSPPSHPEPEEISGSLHLKSMYSGDDSSTQKNVYISPLKGKRKNDNNEISSVKGKIKKNNPKPSKAASRKRKKFPLQAEDKKPTAVKNKRDKSKTYKEKESLSKDEDQEHSKSSNEGLKDQQSFNQSLNPDFLRDEEKMSSLLTENRIDSSRNESLADPPNSGKRQRRQTQLIQYPFQDVPAKQKRYRSSGSPTSKTTRNETDVQDVSTAVDQMGSRKLSSLKKSPDRQRKLYRQLSSKRKVSHSQKNKNRKSSSTPVQVHPLSMLPGITPKSGVSYRSRSSFAIHSKNNIDSSLRDESEGCSTPAQLHPLSMLPRITPKSGVSYRSRSSFAIEAKSNVDSSLGDESEDIEVLNGTEDQEGRTPVPMSRQARSQTATLRKKAILNSAKSKSVRNEDTEANLTHCDDVNSTNGEGDSTVLPSPSSSPVHYMETTTNRRSSILPLPDYSRKIVPPEVAEDGLRRSKRTKVQRLSHEMGEGIIYKRDSTGFGRVVDRVQPSTCALTMMRKEKERKKKMRQRNFAIKTVPVRQKRLSVHRKVERELMDSTEVPVINPETKETVSIELIARSRTAEWFGPDLYPVTSTDPMSVCMLLKQPAFATGEIHMRPYSEKEKQFTIHTIIYSVLRGKISVTVNDITFVVESSDDFFIPRGSWYSIQNLRKDVARIKFFNLKDDTGQVSDSSI